MSKFLSPPLSHDKRDGDGKLGTDLLGLVGTRFVHAVTLKTYEVISIDWMAAEDSWGIRHVEVVNGKLHDVALVRTYINFFDKIEVLRFRQADIDN